ncbi:MAG: c-type cytochrome [Alphaproteobacteria bacterium]
MARIQFVVAAVCAAALLFPAATEAAEDGHVERGETLARAWCAGCHIIDRTGAGTARDAAPAFYTIAVKRKRTPDYLRGWLQSGNLHVQMPNFSLGRQDTEDLIAYFRKLARE